MRHAFAVAVFALAVPLLAGPATDSHFMVRAVSGPADVVWFAVTLPHNPVRNAPTSMQVVAQNSSYQTVPGYTGTVHFSADDPSVELPPDYTFTGADAGSHTFTVIFHRGYQHQVWVTDLNSGAGGSAEGFIVCPDITLTATNDGPICPGSMVTLSASTNATSPSWNWHAAHGAAGYPTYYTQTAVAPYASAWEVYMDDAGTGCHASAQTNVEFEPPPDITIPQSTSGDFTASIASDPNGPYSNIQWSVGDGTIIGGAGTATITVRPNGGVSRVSIGVTATRIATNCTRSESDLYVDVNPAPLDVTVTTPPSVCPNATNISASVPDNGQGAVYTWQVNNGTLVSGQGTRTIVYNAGASSKVFIFITVQRNSQNLSGSAEVPIASPTVMVSGGGEICPGQSAVVTATFSGVPPFSAAWSDGVVQNGINTYSIDRTVTPDASPLLIAHFADSSCDGTATGEARFMLLQDASIDTQPADTSVLAGTAATLSVGAFGDHLSFQWFEGTAGDMSKPVMTGASTFTTPPLGHTTSYWVLVRGACGAAESRAATVTVDPRRRATRR
ncbi:MAG TPA: hypothetical protein VJ901_03150 [Thermoanaerobaculia bacterium]|nr:hypothetical protein [Thermoanaerobaculia bacterium]